MVPAAPSKLWWCFIALFALQLAAWTAWFIVASHLHVAEVPLEKVGRVIPNPPPQGAHSPTAR
jgi:hypothetical protein